MTSDIDCAIYDEIGDVELKMKNNVCYEDPKHVLKKDCHDGGHVLKKKDSHFSSNTVKKVVIFLAVVTGLLTLGLTAGCTFLAMEIAVLRSQVGALSQTASPSTVSDNSTNIEPAQVRSFQQVLNTVSNKLENITDQINSTDAQFRSVQQTINIRIENVEDQLINMTSYSQYFRLFQQALNNLTDKLDNVTGQLNNVTFERFQQTSSTVSEKLKSVTYKLNNVSEQVQQLSISSFMSDQQLQNTISKLSFEFNSPSFAASSCAALPPSSPSGYYWVGPSSGSAVHVYCDMTRSCGGVTGGWMRVAHLDMTDSSQQCPSGFNQRTDSSIRSCSKSSINCSSISAPVFLNYTRVCGRVIAYQKGVTEALRDSSGGINSSYVDGVSITHGSPRQHIWTFASAANEAETLGPSLSCPCIRGSQVTTIPSFIGKNYFCDTGSHNTAQFGTFYTNPLWDGAGCGPLNTCCSFNTPPWFYRQLPQSTTDDIEIRVCTNHRNSFEDIAVVNYDVFVR